MFCKFVVFAVLVVSTLAVEPHEVNSYVSYNDNHNSVQHIQSAPTVVNVATPEAHLYAAQATPIYAAPAVAGAAPIAQYPAPSAYYAASVSPVYSAPSLVNYATPTTGYFNAPASPVYAKLASVGYAAPVSNSVDASTYSKHQEEYAHPKYEYAYTVEDHHTGDLHSQQEQRDGDHVVGQYSLQEADGTIRIVRYYDDGHGFNAVVERQGTPTEAPVVYKKVIVPVADAHH